MLLYNDYIYTLLGCNYKNLLPIENKKGLERSTGSGTSEDR
jgi:hypothetical protein